VLPLEIVNYNYLVANRPALLELPSIYDPYFDMTPEQSA
jgi:hypothetical protein